MNRADIPLEAAHELARILLDRAGLKSAPDGVNGLRLAIAARLDALGANDPLAYVRSLVSGNEPELRALLPLVTVGKTDFFRDPNQFRALRKLMPELLQRVRREHRQMRIWSAGCATGEEPYSIALLALELGVLHEELDLLATDVNPSAVASAAQGRFSRKRLAPVPEAQREQYFVERPDAFYASVALRSMIRFATQNLAGDDFPAPAAGGHWDLILCRNVIIYFDGPTTSRVMQRFYDLLAPGAYLFLGYSESLYRLFGGFELVEVEGAFLYRRPMKDQKPSPPRAVGEESVAALRKIIDDRRAQPTVRPPLAERTHPSPVPRVVPPPSRRPADAPALAPPGPGLELRWTDARLTGGSPGDRLDAKDYGIAARLAARETLAWLEG
ncbi:MAG: CheR family methyltransferase, partial [Myxococcales bacterium]